MAALIAECWAQDAGARPSAAAVVARLSAFVQEVSAEVTSITTASHFTNSMH